MVLLRVLRRGGLGGVEIVAVDAGPGHARRARAVRGRPVHRRARSASAWAPYAGWRAPTTSLPLRRPSAPSSPRRSGRARPGPPPPVAGLTRADRGRGGVRRRLRRAADRPRAAAAAQRRPRPRPRWPPAASEEGTPLLPATPTAESPRRASSREMHRTMSAHPRCRRRRRARRPSGRPGDLRRASATSPAAIVGHGRSRGLMSDARASWGTTCARCSDVSYDLEPTGRWW